MYQVDRTHVSRTFRLADSLLILLSAENAWGGRVVRWCWVNLQFRGVSLFWTIVGQGPIALAVGAGWGCLDIFLSSVISLFSPSLWETARYRLKYCLKGPLSPKPTNGKCRSFTDSTHRYTLELHFYKKQNDLEHLCQSS